MAIDDAVPKEMSKWLERAKLYREQADYGDFYIVSAQEAEAQIASAREFIAAIEMAIGNLLNQQEGQIEERIEPWVKYQRQGEFNLPPMPSRNN